jgi:hypothetical protein
MRFACDCEQEVNNVKTDSISVIAPQQLGSAR